MLSLSDKRHFYIVQLNELDALNRDLKDRICTLSSHSNLPKNNAFLSLISRLKRLVEANCQLREQYRLRVRRLKGTIKEKNRHDND